VITSGGKKRYGRLIPRHENRNALPTFRGSGFEPKNIDVPICRTFNVPDGERDVIESFQFKHCGQSNGRGVLKKAKFRGARRHEDCSVARTIPVPARD
jgi:hypothetical protein